MDMKRARMAVRWTDFRRTLVPSVLCSNGLKKATHMLRSLALRAIACCITLMLVTNALLAQGPSLEKALQAYLPRSLIDDITETPAQVVVRGTMPAGSGKQHWWLICERTGERRSIFAIQDLELKTDDRWGLEAGNCDSLLAAARKRKEAQGQ
jgi:hypothetical protein